jgi:hypothetical protein
MTRLSALFLTFAILLMLMAVASTAHAHRLTGHDYRFNGALVHLVSSECLHSLESSGR